jgi:riboflavin kinase/FMN adenylyltransferase
MDHDLKITISGKVIHGAKYGRKLGFPTANLDRRSYSRRGLKVKLGIYSGTALILNSQFAIRNSQSYNAAIVIGPIDNKGLPKIEAHLLNFKGDLYGKKMLISLGRYIRPFREFGSEAELKNQIKNDLKKIN